MRYFSAIRVAALLAALAAGYALSDEPPANWPRWRGPDGSGVAAGANLPAEWSSTKNILWKTPIPGRGHSSPVVWGNRIFLTTSFEGPAVPGAKAPVHILKGEEYRHPDSEGAERSYALRVMALDADTGAILWAQTAYRGRVYDNRHRKNTYASPTAATDGQLVYFYFGSAGLYAYNFAGEQVWKETGRVPVPALNSQETATVYVPWEPVEAGLWPVRCSLTANGDVYPANNSVQRVFRKP